MGERDHAQCFFASPAGGQICYINGSSKQNFQISCGGMSDFARIKAGQRYVEMGTSYFGRGYRSIWAVADTFRAGDGVMYAHLVSEKDRYRKKTLSAAALADTGRFRPVATDE